MAHTLNTTTTEAGTTERVIERKCVEIYIDVDPRRPMGLRLYYADVTTEIFTPAGGGPLVVKVTDCNPVGMASASAAEIAALPSFASVYADLKTLADAKAVLQWPEISG